MNEKVTIILFDEEELTKTLIESYLKEITFPYEVLKFGAFDKDLISNNSSKKIIIVNVNNTNFDLIDSIPKLTENKNNNFVFISYDKSTDLQVKSLRSGALDFLTKPLIQTDFIYSLTQIYKKNILANNNNKTSKVYSVVSPIPNVGKTFFSFNLAKELADLTRKPVILLDFNNSLNDLNSILNLNVEYNIPTFVNKLTYENADEILKHVSKYKNSTLSIIANGVFRNECTSVDNDKIKQFIEILKQRYSYIIIDTPDATSFTTIDLMHYSYKTFFIIEPVVTIIDSLKNYIKRYLQKVSYRLIVNKFSFEKDENILSEIEKEIGKQAFGKIQKNVIVTSGAFERGISLKEFSPKVDVVQFYTKLASYIVNRDK